MMSPGKGQKHIQSDLSGPYNLSYGPPLYIYSAQKRAGEKAQDVNHHLNKGVHVVCAPV